ncbi:helix-turn-helix transcriptional regulator [Streptomyces sp. NPDC007000]|uniref:helix-turn-helix transcriptional regulator n=1 Tax=Streptomyces sp. NPDC007000 TaxID=3155357 RepID=UPI0033CDF495
MPNATQTTRQQQARLRQEMTEAGLSIDRIAAEMTRRFQLRPRTAYRVACGLTQQQAADRYNGRAVQAGADALGAATMDASRISNIEAWPAGGRRPTLPVLKILARAYSTTINRLVDFDDLTHMPDSDRQALLNLRPAAPQHPAERSTPSRRLTQRRILNDVLINQAAEESLALGRVFGCDQQMVRMRSLSQIIEARR